VAGGTQAYAYIRSPIMHQASLAATRTIPTMTVPSIRVTGKHTSLLVGMGLQARLTKALYRVGAVAKANPMKFGMVCSTAKCLVGDYIAQRAAGGEYDYRRGLVFGGFGVVYVGFWQFCLYNKIYNVMFASGNILGKQLFDSLGHMPWMYMPVFYTFHTVGEKATNPCSDRSVKSIYNEARDKWDCNFWGDFKGNCGFWGPVTLVMFKFIPSHLRIPWLSALGVVYYAGLSCNRGELNAMEPDPAATCTSRERAHEKSSVGSDDAALENSPIRPITWQPLTIR